MNNITSSFTIEVLGNETLTAKNEKTGRTCKINRVNSYSSSNNNEKVPGRCVDFSESTKALISKCDSVRMVMIDGQERTDIALPTDR